MTETTETTRPEGWPEMYSAAGQSMSCPHQMHWDNSDKAYHCINGCGKTDQTPPHSKRTGTIVSFKPRSGRGGSLPPNPVEAQNHQQFSLETGSGKNGEIIPEIVTNDLKAHDATRLGWIAYYPERMQLTANPETGNPDISLLNTDRDVGTVVTETDMENVVRVDLQWDVEIPPEMVLQAYSPFNHWDVDGVSVVSSVVAGTEACEHRAGQHDGEFTPLQVYLRVDSDAVVTREMPCVQLVLREAVADRPGTRALSEDEMNELERHDRAMEIYPDWYENLRDEDRH